MQTNVAGRCGPSRAVAGRRGPLGHGPAFSKTQYPSANHASSKPVQIPLPSLEAEACHWPSQVILAHCSLGQWTTANFYCNTQNVCKQSMVAACIRPRGGGTLGISGWGCAARTLEPLAYTRAIFSRILLPYTRVNSQNHSWIPIFDT